MEHSFSVLSCLIADSIVFPLEYLLRKKNQRFITFPQKAHFPLFTNSNSTDSFAKVIIKLIYSYFSKWRSIINGINHSYTPTTQLSEIIKVDYITRQLSPPRGHARYI